MATQTLTLPQNNYPNGTTLFGPNPTPAGLISVEAFLDNPTGAFTWQSATQVVSFEIDFLVGTVWYTYSGGASGYVGPSKGSHRLDWGCGVPAGTTQYQAKVTISGGPITLSGAVVLTS